MNQRTFEWRLQHKFDLNQEETHVLVIFGVMIVLVPINFQYLCWNDSSCRARSAQLPRQAHFVLRPLHFSLRTGTRRPHCGSESNGSLGAACAHICPHAASRWFSRPPPQSCTFVVPEHEGFARKDIVKDFLEQVQWLGWIVSYWTARELFETVLDCFQYIQPVCGGCHVVWKTSFRDETPGLGCSVDALLKAFYAANDVAEIKAKTSDHSVKLALLIFSRPKIFNLHKHEK